MLPRPVAITLAALLIVLSATFSGLTLGLMSLDNIELQVQADAGDASEARHARRILPLRRRGNLLLCTLLLGNTLVNSAVAILLSDVTSGALGLVLSTAVILVFGEIVPQAVCSRHGLAIGAHLSLVVRFFMLLFLPVTWPIAWVLDKLLGKDIGSVYNRQEMKRLIDIHVTDPDAAEESGLNAEDGKLLTGALDFKNRQVREIFTPLDDVFAVSIDTVLDFDTLVRIYRSGYTRIPVYMGDRTNVVGILYAKDLVLVSPESSDVDVRAMLGLRGESSKPNLVREDASLGMVLEHFKNQQCHVLVTVRPPAPAPAPVVVAAAKPQGGEGAKTEGEEDETGKPAATSAAVTTAAAAGCFPPASKRKRRSWRAFLPSSRSSSSSSSSTDDDKAQTTTGAPPTHPLVVDGLMHEATGIVTLEDVLEEILMDEIVDEHDEIDERISERLELALRVGRRSLSDRVRVRSASSIPASVAVPPSTAPTTPGKLPREL